jgi:uncharacterized damage-inducible protein DinB
MTLKQEFLNWKEWEFNTTVKVLNALPAGQENFKPHERSRSVKELAATLANEEIACKQIVDGNLDFPNLPKDIPETWEAILDLYKKNYEISTEAVKNAPDSDLENSEIDFGGHKSTKIDALWSMLLDMVHHRGQFSVYLRMAGGKVPSIYGPSADDPGDAK